MLDLAHWLLLISIIAQIITIIIKFSWGIIVIEEGKSGRPWKNYIGAWEFNLGMMLVSAAMVLCLFEFLALATFFHWSIPSMVWFAGFCILSTHAAIWAGLAWWVWWKRRFVRVPPATP